LDFILEIAKNAITYKRVFLLFKMHCHQKLPWLLFVHMAPWNMI